MRRGFGRFASKAGGFVRVGQEDFGITMVEALAAGAPVIALNSGGAVDIVRDGVDGILIDTATPEAIGKGVHDAAARDWDSAALAKRADAFSGTRFAERFGAHLEDVMAALRAG